MPQGRFLAYADALDRHDRRRRLETGSFFGMAMGGSEPGAWEDLWESTLTEAEKSARYDYGWEELQRRDALREQRRGR